MTEAEIQTRTCRSCGRTFRYPVPRSLATRFHCDSCVRLDEATRETFEQVQKELQRLRTELKKVHAAAPASQKPQ